ncbi:hypothetical protein [Actinokineospora globicatena]|uniref:Diguanylate cyclase, GGDEF domain n=1 Tax=Actinokineospora globicatena TaxID=103729 RepID=A0A9W6VBA3_9PSEU|nr:hypothetical protein [Actinokineospora globicatena]GLW93784.1 hypothetical protein Aglo03_46000 [Actinokineospora globicatena]
MAAWNELPAAGTAECAALVAAADRLRWSAPELAVQFADRSLRSGAADAATTTKAQVLLGTSLVRLGRHAEAVEPALAALRAVTGGGLVERAAAVRVALAACARVLGEPLVGSELLRPVLRASAAAPATRALALGQFVACAGHVGRRDDLEDALAEADRLLAADESLSQDARKLERALLCVRAASYHRRHGDTEAATEVAREGLALLNRITGAGVEAGLAKARLVLEMVCALLDDGDIDEASLVAVTVLGEPVRATSALALGRLRLAMASRVHLPSGRAELGHAMLLDVVRIADRHRLDSLVADAWTFLAHAEEEAGHPSEALHALRSARAAEYRYLRAASTARGLLVAEVGTAVNPESVVSLLRATVRPAVAVEGKTEAAETSSGERTARKATSATRRAAARDATDAASPETPRRGASVRELASHGKQASDVSVPVAGADARQAETSDRGRSTDAAAREGTRSRRDGAKHGAGEGASAGGSRRRASLRELASQGSAAPGESRPGQTRHSAADRDDADRADAGSAGADRAGAGRADAGRSADRGAAVDREAAADHGGATGRGATRRADVAGSGGATDSGVAPGSEIASGGGDAAGRANGGGRDTARRAGAAGRDSGARGVAGRGATAPGSAQHTVGQHSAGGSSADNRTGVAGRRPDGAAESGSAQRSDARVSGVGPVEHSVAEQVMEHGVVQRKAGTSGGEGISPAVGTKADAAASEVAGPLKADGGAAGAHRGADGGSPKVADEAPKDGLLRGVSARRVKRVTTAPTRHEAAAVEMFAVTLVRVSPKGVAEPVEPEELPLPVGGEVTLNALAIHVRDLAPSDAELLRSDRGEFAVLLPSTTLAEAETLADAIRQTAPDAQWLIDDQGQELTISTGVAALPGTVDGPHDGIEALLLAARSALTVPEPASPAPAVLRRTDRFRRSPTTAKTVPLSDKPARRLSGAVRRVDPARHDSGLIAQRADDSPTIPDLSLADDNPTIPAPTSHHTAADATGEAEQTEGRWSVETVRTTGAEEPASQANTGSMGRRAARRAKADEPQESTVDEQAGVKSVLSRFGVTAEGGGRRRAPDGDDDYYDPNALVGTDLPTPLQSSAPPASDPKRAHGTEPKQASQPPTAPKTPAGTGLPVPPMLPQSLEPDTDDPRWAHASVPESKAPEQAAQPSAATEIPSPDRVDLPTPPMLPQSLEPDASDPRWAHASVPETTAPERVAQPSVTPETPGPGGVDLPSTPMLPQSLEPDASDPRWAHASVPGTESKTPEHVLAARDTPDSSSGGTALPSTPMLPQSLEPDASDPRWAQASVPVAESTGPERVVQAPAAPTISAGTGLPSTPMLPQSLEPDANDPRWAHASVPGTESKGSERAAQSPAAPKTPAGTGLPVPPMLPQSLEPDADDPRWAHASVPGAESKGSERVAQPSVTSEIPAGTGLPSPPMLPQSLEPDASDPRWAHASVPGTEPKGSERVAQSGPKIPAGTALPSTPMLPQSLEPDASDPRWAQASVPVAESKGPERVVQAPADLKSPAGTGLPVPPMLPRSLEPDASDPRWAHASVPGTEPKEPEQVPQPPATPEIPDPGTPDEIPPAAPEPTAPEVDPPPSQVVVPRKVGQESGVRAAGQVTVEPAASANERRAIDFAARLRGLPRTTAAATEPAKDEDDRPAPDDSDQPELVDLDPPDLPARRRRTPSGRRERTNPSGLADLLAEALVAFKATQPDRPDGDANAPWTDDWPKAPTIGQTQPTAESPPAAAPPGEPGGSPNSPPAAHLDEPTGPLPESDRTIGTQVHYSAELRKPRADPAKTHNTSELPRWSRLSTESHWPDQSEWPAPSADGPAWAADARAAEPGDRSRSRRADRTSPHDDPHGRHRSSEWAPADFESG